MRAWQGIRRDTADTADDGSLLAINPTYYIDGEMRRRPGMTGFPSTASGTSICNYYSPITGYWAIFDTSTGTVEAFAAP